MYGEIITIGNELLSGRTLDLNAWYAAGRLTASGLQVLRITSVGDDEEMVSEAVERALGRSLFIIVTGGLGSTEDDITNEIVARALKRPLCLHQGMYDRIKSHLEQRDMPMTPSFEKMAILPEGSRMLHPKGMSCGFSLTEHDVALYCLPGVPDQMRYLMDRCVLPELLALFTTLPVMRQRILKLYGLHEPAIAEIFRTLQGKTEGVLFGFYPRFPENHITMSLRGEDEAHITLVLDRVEGELRRLLGPYVFAGGSQTMEQAVGDLLLARQLSLATAESCTGGLIGHLITNTPGSSRYYVGGLSAYRNRVKVQGLGVREETLREHGAVSHATVKEMASGARVRLGTDMGISVSGIAGPEGGTFQKPVGTVFIGLAAAQELLSVHYRFWGTREQIKQQAAVTALDCLRRYLNGDPFLSGL